MKMSCLIAIHPLAPPVFLALCDPLCFLFPLTVQQLTRGWEWSFQCCCAKQEVRADCHHLHHPLALVSRILHNMVDLCRSGDTGDDADEESEPAYLGVQQPEINDRP